MADQLTAGDQIMADELRLEFGNLPLVETAVRASFTKPVKLKFSRINDIHKMIENSFPNISEQPNYEATPGVADEITIRPGAITGVVFNGNQEGLRCTLQGRVAIVRWLKQFTEGAPPYPRFPKLKAALKDVLSAVMSAYELESFPVAVVNLSYVNFILVTDFSDYLRKYFSDQVQVRATDGADEIRKLEISWRKKGVDLRFLLEKVSATIGEQVSDGCRLTTIAGMNVEAKDGDWMKTLQDVHDHLQVFFRDVISEKAKQEWQLKGAPNG